MHIEHGFGSSCQTQYNEHSEVPEYLYAKRKIESKKILQMCETPFFFKAAEKDYSEAILTSNMSTREVFQTIRKFQDVLPLRTHKEPKTSSGLELIKLAHRVSKGQRSKASRSYHKPSPYYGPEQITRYHRTTLQPLHLPTPDTLPEVTLPEDVRTTCTDLTDGIVVFKDNWVVFKFGDEIFIGLYKESIGSESLIDSTENLQNGLFGWPCHCNTDYELPIIACTNNECKDISWIPTHDIVFKFECPEITRRGFKIPASYRNLYNV